MKAACAHQYVIPGSRLHALRGVDVIANEVKQSLGIGRFFHRLAKGRISLNDNVRLVNTFG